MARALSGYTPENIKAGIISDYGIPEAVMDQRAITQGLPTMAESNASISPVMSDSSTSADISLSTK